MRDRGFFLFLVVIGALSLLANEQGPKRAVLPDNAVSIQPEAQQTVQKTIPEASVLLDFKKELSAGTLVRYQYVQVEKLNVRVSPDSSSEKRGIILRGVRLRVYETKGGWARVSDPQTKLSGWVSANFLGNTKRPSIAIQNQAVVPKALVVPKLDRSTIVKNIIQDSIASYPGRCPCPYHVDRAGRSCGKRSAYSRAGGYSVICYPGDVTEEMIAARQ